MKHTGIITYLIISLSFFAISCKKNYTTADLFTNVNELMDEHPDSALSILDSARYDKSAWSEAEQMQYELLHAKAQNRAYVDFTTDSIMLEVAAYYDAHGTANEQMEAHYLLGCAYRDLKESPMALSCYLDATEKADTLSKDCDYGTLMRIWGQVANEYDNQLMPYKELEALVEYRKNALKNKDTLNYILGIDLERQPYILLYDTTKVLNIIDTVFNMYKQKGYDSYAANAILPTIPIYLENGDIEKAEQLMLFFEETIQVFDSEGKIAKGKEHYYNIKALYYECCNDYDNATTTYRNLLNYGYEYDAYKGLLSIYSKRKLTDSICKYSILKEKAFDSEFSDLHTQAMFNADGMFSYGRNQRIALEKKIEAERILTRSIVLGVSALILIVIGLILFLRYKKRKSKELEQISVQFHQKECEYNKAIEDYTLMESDFEAYKAKKSEEIKQLKESKEFASAIYERAYRCEELSSLCNNEVIKRILQNEKINHNHHSEISDEQWEQVYALFEKKVPQLYNNYITRLQLSERERRTLILTCLGINTKSIGVLLNMTVSNVSNIKASINQKLFSDSSAKSLYDNIINL